MEIPTSRLLRQITAATLFALGVALTTAAEKNAAATAPASAVDPFALPATEAGLPGVGPLRRTESYQKNWHDRRTVWAKRTAADHGAVVFLGDSITQGWGLGLGAVFPGVKVANRGISGDTTRGVLIRLEADVLALAPRAVVLLIGINDLAEAATPETIAANLRLIVAALEQHDPKMPIVLCQVFPSSAEKKLPADQIKAINALYLEVVRNHANITYLESWPLFADAKGDAIAEEFPDLLHPNEAGYAKWAAALRTIFSTLGITPEAPDPFTPEPGFVSLFNGTDLSGWGFRATPKAEIEAAKQRDASNPKPPVRIFFDAPVRFAGATVTPEGRYLAKHGRLVVTTPPEYRKIQQLYTERDFPTDFILKLEFRASVNADSGVYIRGPQLQVRDYLLAGPYNQLKKYRPQDWNELEITVRGTVATCTCNGEVIEAAFKIPATGPIGLEGDRGQMEYRRIRVKTLP